MNTLLEKLNIDETYTRSLPKEKAFSKVKDNVPLKEDYNFMADLLFLPKTSSGYRYLLVVVDLATDEFDIEPLKTKQPKEVLEAFKTMFSRPYIKKPYASLRTDAGLEFKGEFAKYLYNESILHRIAVPGRHKQTGNVEALNRQLGRLLNGYMNHMEEKTKKQYNDWDDILDTIREDLNKIRKKDLDKLEKERNWDVIIGEPKYEIGDLVYYKLDKPINALGHQQNSENFRMGDYRFDVKNPRKIRKVLYYNGDVPFRYLLNGRDNVSYSEAELLPAVQEEETYTIKKILDRRTIKRVVHYLIWFNGDKKKDAVWLPKSQLIEDGLEWALDNFDQSLKTSKKK